MLSCLCPFRTPCWEVWLYVAHPRTLRLFFLMSKSCFVVAFFENQPPTPKLMRTLNLNEPLHGLMQAQETINPSKIAEPYRNITKQTSKIKKWKIDPKSALGVPAAHNTLTVTTCRLALKIGSIYVWPRGEHDKTHACTKVARCCIEI